MSSTLPCCPICKSDPYVHSGNVITVGCEAKIWMVECYNDDKDQSKTPFMEHNICIYGSTKEEAERRWIEICDN